MFKENEYLVYKKEVCVVKEIKKNHLDNSDCYVLIPVNDQSLKIEISTANKLNNIRKLATKQEIKDLIKKIPSIDIIKETDRLIENEYKELLHNGTYEDLIKIIKTTYLRNKKREDDKKRLSDKDLKYSKLAEKYLYTEFSIVLDMSYDETKEYIENEVRKLDKNER